MSLVGIIVSILIFSLIILLHEWGHYASARLFGVKVEEFGLGIPPRAKKLWRNASGTLFSLNWLPLGGFVRIAGENELHLHYFDESGKKLDEKNLKKKLHTGEEIFYKDGNKISLSEKKYLVSLLVETKKQERFSSKNIFQKITILAAGVVMNFITAFVIFFILFLVGVKPLGINTILPIEDSSLIVPSYEDAISKGILEKHPGILLFPTKNSLAQKAGIQEGDLLVQIDKIDISDIQKAQKYIQNSPEKTLIFSVERASEKIQIPIYVGKDGKIGSYLSENISYNQDFLYQFGWKDSAKYALQETYVQIKLTFAGIKMLGQKIFFPKDESERKQAMQEVSGPIGIVSVVNNSLDQGIIFLSLLAALISINLGVLNILPIPALDGGRIFLLCIRQVAEWITGKKKILQNVENFVHIFFFALIIALSFIIAYNDIMKILSEK